MPRHALRIRKSHIARDIQISTDTIYTWRRQDRIDRGLVPGVSTAEQGELATPIAGIVTGEACAAAGGAMVTAVAC